MGRLVIGVQAGMCVVVCFDEGANFVGVVVAGLLVFEGDLVDEGVRRTYSFVVVDASDGSFEMSVHFGEELSDVEAGCDVVIVGWAIFP